MPNTVAVRRLAPAAHHGRTPAPTPAVLSPHPRVIIQTENGTLHASVPFAPKSISASGLAAPYTEVQRPGRAPLVLRSGDPLPKLSFDLLLAAEDHQTSVEDILASLGRLAESRERIVLRGLGPSEGGAWRLVDYSWSSMERQHGTNAITRATVTLALTRAVDPPTVSALRGSGSGRGPVGGGVRPPAGGRAPAPKNKTVVVKKGQTLHGIAAKQYGDASKWKHIATKNKIKHPRKLQAGRKLVIPPLGKRGAAPKHRPVAHPRPVRAGTYARPVMPSRISAAVPRPRAIQPPVTTVQATTRHGVAIGRSVAPTAPPSSRSLFSPERNEASRPGSKPAPTPAPRPAVKPQTSIARLI